MNKQYIASERAHFMCPNMHFGMLVTVKAKLDQIKVEQCMMTLAKAHPFLRSLIEYDTDGIRLYYDIQNQSQVPIIVRNSVDTVWEDYETIGQKEWNVFQNGLLQLFAYPMGEQMQLLFVAHHLLGDGRCILELVDEYVNLYTEGVEPAYVEEKLIQTMDDLPEKSELPAISNLLIKRFNKQWRKENQKVSYDTYATFADQFSKENPVSHEVSSVDPECFQYIKKTCKDNQVTINDWLMAKLYRDVPCNKIIIAADIRSMLTCYNKGAYGNYATAMGVVCKDKNDDLIQKAKQVHTLVQKLRKRNKKLMMVLSCYLAMDPELIYAAAIAGLNGFESKAAKFVDGQMFGFAKRDGISITNLGAVKNTNMVNGIFIPPASPATKQTIGVLTVNDKMNLCSSFYEQSIKKIDVKKQLHINNQTANVIN